MGWAIAVAFINENRKRKDLNSKKIILAGIVDGVFTADPQKDPSAKLIPVISSKNYESIKKYLGGSAGIDVTGGMLHRVERIFELTKNGVEADIINGLKEDYLKRALLGEKGLGTVIKL